MGREIGVVRSTPGVQGGLPVIQGTRVPSSAIWSFHAAGYSTASILKEYPHLTREDVEGAISSERRRRLLAVSRDLYAAAGTAEKAMTIMDAGRAVDMAELDARVRGVIRSALQKLREVTRR